jgi:acyl-CoA thioester hydrolase
MKLGDFKHIKKVKIRYDDLDTLGHVNNKAYLAYLEEARIDFHHMLFNWKGKLAFNIVVARIEINYLLPVFYDDELSLHTKISTIGNKSFELETLFVVSREEKNSKVAEAKVVLVNIELKSGETVSLPENERNRLVEFRDNKI